jgi:hypothetical protein
MAKGTLTFDLDDPDDRDAFNRACKADDYQIFIWDYSQEVIRPLWKHGIPEELKDPDALLEHLRDKFFETLSDRGLSDTD